MNTKGSEGREGRKEFYATGQQQLATPQSSGGCIRTHQGVSLRPT